MRVKLSVLGLILMLVVATVTLQLAIFGNYEEMVELEYEEYQIQFDYNRMVEGILNLFNHETSTRRSRHQQQTEENPSSSDTHNGNAGTTLQTAPTVPTLQTINTVGGGQ